MRSDVEEVEGEEKKKKKKKGERVFGKKGRERKREMFIQGVVCGQWAFSLIGFGPIFTIKWVPTTMVTGISQRASFWVKRIGILTQGLNWSRLLHNRPMSTSPPLA